MILVGGIETEQALEFLADRNCPLGQGGTSSRMRLRQRRSRSVRRQACGCQRAPAVGEGALSPRPNPDVNVGLAHAVTNPLVGNLNFATSALRLAAWSFKCEAAAAVCSTKAAFCCVI